MAPRVNSKRKRTSGNGFEGRAAEDQRVACGQGFVEQCTWAATTPLDAAPPDVLQRTDGRRMSASADSGRGGPDDPFGERELRVKIASLTADLDPAMAEGLRGLMKSQGRWAMYGRW